MFHERLKELRHEKNVTQAQFAKDLNVSRATTGMWENGKREPNIEMLVRISDYFSVSLDYLLGRTDTPEYKKMPAELADIGVKEVVTADGKPLTSEEIDAIRRLIQERNG